MPLLAVFGVGFIEIWFAVPTGLALGLPAPIVWVMTVAGSMTSVSLVAFAGEALRGWLIRRRGKDWPNKTGRVFGLWMRYGIPGWGLVSPLFMSPPMGTAVALMLGAPKRRLLVWMFAGVMLWTTILVAAGIIGLGLIHDAIH
ncbi:MAG TPA: hypothetical protein VF344_04545 [Candidatus Limnocylindrales bacterium]